MAVSASTSSTLPLLFLHRATTSPNPTALSFTSSLRASPLRSRAAASPTEVLADDLPSDTPPVGEGAGIPMPSSIGDDGEQLAPKQKIRIKLRSYWVPLIEDSCKQIIEAAKTTNAKTMGPVPLPTKKRIYCVLNSPHVHKDSRFHFEIRTHQRLIDIMYPTAQTIDSLMQLQLPAGVDVEVKL
ncbi:cyanelle 30S ribosomal protein S10 isoform X2 [Brachypodium distachyon]|uniref:cyanelle 30S ribosomal protein S10 isoform X2 n=1 Tax=Brachypodium distachyon TaxID=15368 RepID=UPI000234E9A9|nr:cyanelle 30S ribosomal protein S10 isoform X2 [Brachypodium distachyon]|eukprot:XP_003558591.1 cyanelle 30S ribosomal protein S10 isoform X2 [Brachypodium distachyon]